MYLFGLTDSDNVIMTVIKKRFDGDYSDVGMGFMFVNENCHFAVSTRSSFINISVTKHHASMNRSL
jgi:hypothetical protein